MGARYIRWFRDLGMNDIGLVGGKNASLGEMIAGMRDTEIRVPDGFAITSEAYRAVLHENGLESVMEELLRKFQNGQSTLEDTGREIRRLIARAEWPTDLTRELREAYGELSRIYSVNEADVAVRSSATAEDLPDASFAGQQESFLNISGTEELLDACRHCFASLFTDRAIAYREHGGFEHMEVALSIGVQKMVRSDLAGAGVMFTLDPETGFPGVVVINAVLGLGETIVQGTATPDEYQVFKSLLSKPELSPIIRKEIGAKEVKMVHARGKRHPTRIVNTTARESNAFVLRDEEVLQLARWAVLLEEHYGRPMDIEWARDGQSGDLFIVQARPETIHSRSSGAVIKTYHLKERSEEVVSGIAVGEGIAAGKAVVLHRPGKSEEFPEGAILVAETTDPDWVPIMKKAAGIITDHGGRTSHAAIISRELGVPAIVGCENAGHRIQTGDELTVSCAEGPRGKVFTGLLDFDCVETDMTDSADTKTRIMLNVAGPDTAFRWWRLPCNGVGLARMEFIISNMIKIHPMALLKYPDLKSLEAAEEIARLTKGYEDKGDYFVERLAMGIAGIAASRYPDPVIVRMSDFKSNEYADLIGGREFEPHEENPMIGFRGASRYYSDEYRRGFALECRAIDRVRRIIGLDNVWIMIPFCRTLDEADNVLRELSVNDLRRGENGLKIYVMCEIPSNVILAEEFADRFDGFSIGSNDLTQLTLGVDRDSEELAYLFDERNEAVKRMIRMVLEKAHGKGSHVGICGQAPSDYPEFAEFLVEAGIDSISLNPDAVLKTRERIARFESERAGSVS